MYSDSADRISCFFLGSGTFERKKSALRCKCGILLAVFCHFSPLPVAQAQNPKLTWQYSRASSKHNVSPDPRPFIFHLSLSTMLPGETQNCTGSGTVSYDQYRNVGTALGQGPGASTAEDEDPSQHPGLTRNQLFRVPALPPLFFLFSSVTLAGIAG